MFYYLKGKLVLASDGVAVVDCGGVGYKLTVSTTTLSAIVGKDEVLLYTYFAVREDAAELYGFYTTEELDAFCLLIGISGVGPKAAMSVLSLYSPSALADAVAEQNVKLISRAPGVGAKTAQRIILELSGKLTVGEGSGSLSAKKASPASPAVSEAQDALAVLGYTRAEAQAAISAIPDAEGKTTEELIRLALSRMI